MSSFSFIPGWTEGGWQTKKFKKLLIEAGLTSTNDSGVADVIIGHSLGCFLIPRDSEAKAIFLINPPFWPGKSRVSSVAEHFVSGFRMASQQSALWWWFSKIIHNNWYFLTKPKMTYYAHTRHDIKNLPSGKMAHKTTLIRNKNDSFCHPDINKLLDIARGYRYIEIAGDHEDCWLNPAPYVQLIQKELEQVPKS